MAYAIIVPEKTMATDLGSLNVSVVSGSALENGDVFTLHTISGSTGYSEVFYVVAPTAGSLSGLYMAYAPEVVTVLSGTTKYKGIDQDPRNFRSAAGDVVDAFKPMVGDIILMSEDAFTGAKSTNTHANSGEGMQLVWGTTQVASSLCFKYLATDYIVIGSGSAIGDTRVTAYRMLCIAN